MVITKNIRVAYIGKIQNFKGDPKDALSLLDTENGTIVDDLDMTRSHETVFYDNEIYYVFPNVDGLDQNTMFYKKLPSVTNDNLFSWTKKLVGINNKRPCYFATVNSGCSLRFVIRYDYRGEDAQISIYFNHGLMHTVHMTDTSISNDIIRKKISKLRKNIEKIITGDTECDLEQCSSTSHYYKNKYESKLKAALDA